MAKLSVTAIQKAGIADISAAMVAAGAAGDSVDASSGILIAVSNGDAAPHTLTVAKPSTSKDCGNLGALAIDDITLVVAAGKTGFVAIPLGYVDGSGDLAWTYDAVTSMTVGAFSIAP
ncbi:MAG: hypothetical protein KAT62_03875 [Desulfuromonadales bacterium]|nr:hypothetical protein [Desulfuromonadales bacterium]